MHGERSRKKKSNKELPNLFLFASVISNSYFEWIRKLLEQTRKLMNLGRDLSPKQVMM
ncbi:hypothetical protein MTP05_26830 (plasmid) [Enterococcus sp. PLM3]|nr:hypothetical protein MTP05_26830 [Enterococcus sp. PLM3]